MCKAEMYVQKPAPFSSWAVWSDKADPGMRRTVEVCNPIRKRSTVLHLTLQDKFRHNKEVSQHYVGLINS
jgi:hypothetical protein